VATHYAVAVSAAVGLKLTDETSSQVRSATLGADLRETYAAHFSLVYRGLRRLGVPPSLLEDAVQDVFLVVHRRWADFEGRSSVSTWVYGIVLRVAKDYRRAEARHAARAERCAELMALEPSTESSPAEAAERREANRVLHAVLATLTDEQREVLVLVELEELPVWEAAAALGIRVRSCQRRLRAARQAFDSALASYLGHAGRSTR
jgi:RNA polymerase sigma-70 factor (ECF subfamily)